GQQQEHELQSNVFETLQNQDNILGSTPVYDLDGLGPEIALQNQVQTSELIPTSSNYTNNAVQDISMYQSSESSWMQNVFNPQSEVLMHPNFDEPQMFTTNPAMNYQIAQSSRLEHQNQNYNQISAPSVWGSQYAPNYIMPSQNQLLTTPMYQATQNPQMLVDSYSQFQLPIQQTFSSQDVNTRHSALMHAQENNSQVIVPSGNIQHTAFDPMQQLSMFQNRPDEVIYNGEMSNINFQPQTAPFHESITSSFGIPTSEELSIRIFGHVGIVPSEENSLRKAKIDEQRRNDVGTQTVSWDQFLGNTQGSSWNEVHANAQIVSMDEVPANTQNVSWDEILANSQTILRNEVPANQCDKGKLPESPSTGLEHRIKSQLYYSNISESQDSPKNMLPPQMQQVVPVVTTDGVQANQCDKGKLPQSPSTRIHSGTIQRITYLRPNRTVTIVPSSSSSPATQQNQKEVLINQKVDDSIKQGEKDNDRVLPRRRGRPPKRREQGENNLSKLTKKQKIGSSSVVSGNVETTSTPQQQQMTLENVSNVQTR
ncbi:hypothetical protein RYX36_015513, partial [Vicia faba]